MARKLGFPALLGPPGPDRDLAYALIISRVLRPASKLSTAAWWDDVTLGPDLGVAGAGTDDIYAAMDWLTARQDDIEKQLARRHLREGGIAMFDLSSSWVEGTHCELAARGYSRDGKRGKAQIEYGLLTDRDGRPVAVRVFAGNTGDPKTFPEAVEAVRGKFALQQMIMVGDRGMITSARIARAAQAGRAWPGSPACAPPRSRSSWPTAARCSCPCSMSRTWPRSRSPDYPGERLIACRNPFLAAERARKREDLLAATEADLAKIAARVAAGRIKDPDKIGAARREDASTSARSPSTSPSTSPKASWPGSRDQARHRRRGRHRRDLRHPHPRPRETPSAPPARSPPTRTWPTSNATSGTSRPTTWTCGPSGTGSRTASAPTC